MKYARHTDDGWKIVSVYGSGEAASAQASVLEAQGYKRVVEYDPRPEDTQFLVWSAEYEDSGSVVTESFWSSPTIIHLDREKLLDLFSKTGKLEAAIEYFGTDSAAQSWWADNMTYVEGSPMALAAMAALGLSLEEVHEIVRRCMA